MANGKKSNSSLALHLFNVDFDCDLTSSKRRRIPLGVMGYIQFGERFSLGLIARRALSVREAKQLGPIAHQVLASPFEMLKAEHERVMSAPDRVAAIDALVHSASSVSYAPQQDHAVEVPSWVVKKPQTKQAQQFLKDELLSVLREEYWNVFGEGAEDDSILHWHNFIAEPELAEA